jgi:hypothetical protein
LLGKLYGLAGVPGFVRTCEYQAGITNALIQVQVTDLFTIITVNLGGHLKTAQCWAGQNRPTESVRD